MYVKKLNLIQTNIINHVFLQKLLLNHQKLNTSSRMQNKFFLQHENNFNIALSHCIFY